MSNPKFEGCSECEQKEVIQFSEVPQCGSEVQNGPCATNKGKFYDRLLEDFTVPAVGREGLVKVCDPGLWSKCQWIAICYLSEKVAVFQITKIEKTGLRVLNGCKTGEAIYGNPDPGTVFDEGRVLYPIPPQGCDQQFCQRVANAIKTCGVDAVLQVLKDAEEICFTSVPEIEEDERVHLFGGIMPSDDCNCDTGYEDENYISPSQRESLWSSCLRKIIKIFTGSGGRTLCFGDLPAYNSTDANNRYTVIDGKGCIKKGDKIGTDCGSSSLDEDVGADYILVCKNGAKRLFKPGCGKRILSCCDENGTPRWYVKDSGLEYFPLDIEILSRVQVASRAEYTETFNIEDILNAEEEGLYNKLANSGCGDIYVELSFRHRTSASTSSILRWYFYINDELISEYSVPELTTGSNNFTIKIKLPKTSKSLTFKEQFSGELGGSSGTTKVTNICKLKGVYA